MTPIAVPLWLLWSFVVFLLLCLGGCCFFLILWWKLKRSDKILLFDKDKRWELVNTNIKDKLDYSYKDKNYILSQNEGYLNHNGKSLFIFTENKANPMKVEQNTVKGVDATSLKAYVNNKVLQQIVQPSNQARDLIIMLGAIGGMLAAIASGISLLIATGVIAP